MTKKIYFHTWLKTVYNPTDGALNTAHLLIIDKKFPKRTNDYIKLRAYVEKTHANHASFGFHELYNLFFKFLKGTNATVSN
jgi:uncharacterized protein YozE (UPF0346 family)